jgi:periplasmic copper chaperone A
MVLKPLVIAGCLLVFLLIPGAAAAQTGQVEIKDAWARATPGKAENGAAYLTIETLAPDKLVAVSSPAAKKTTLHTMTMDGGVMKMRPLDGLDVPANQPVTLKPGSIHIMLQGLSEPLQAGKSFPLTLTFEKAGERKVEVAVEKPGAMGPEGHAGMPIPMPAHR